jgi:hypothetical protein
MNTAANAYVAAANQHTATSPPITQLTRARESSSTHSAYVSKTVSIQRDTGAWRAQVWISFVIATFLCGVGLAYLPGQDLDRAFMVMGYFFCLSSAFVLSKFVRDNSVQKRDTPMYMYVVFAAFAAAMALTAWGLYRMSIAESYKAYLLVSWLYLITTTFTLAKTLRDAHEVSLLETRESAKRELRAEVSQ